MQKAKIEEKALLTVEDLHVHFPLRRGWFGRERGAVRAVDGVSFSLKRGETLGLVGESGSGKTTTGRSILRAIEPTHGRILFQTGAGEVDVLKLGGSELRHFRRHMQMIFQDPYASLNPRMTVRDIIAEPLVAGGLLQDRTAIDARILETAERCRLNLEHLRRFPHAFSGGQRQRIGIARALVAQPEFIVCDESVSALDVSIQAEILNLLMDLQQEMKLTYLFIAHDLSVVAHISNRVAVMYMGQLVELAPTRRIFYAPQHPYTEALLSAIPTIDPSEQIRHIKLTGEIPSPIHPPAGCRFHTRCPYVQDRCRVEVPSWRAVASEHFVACHFAEELTLQGAQVNVDAMLVI